MAEHGVIQESPLPRWEAEHNRLFRSVAQDEPPSQKIEILICQVRDAIMKLDMSEKAKRNYLYCGLGAVLKHFDFQGEMIYSEELLDTFLADSQEQYLSGEIKQATWQSIRKSVLWIKEYRETEHITHRKLTNTAFIYASPDFERLIQEYAAYMRNADYLKEKPSPFTLQRFERSLSGWNLLDQLSTISLRCAMLLPASARRQQKCR